MKIHLFDIAEMLAFLTSILCFKFIRKTPFVYFIPYLAMIVIVELAGKYLGRTDQTALNIKMYNVSTVIEFLFFY